MSLPGRVFIDTNIPIYASGPSFPLRRPCVQIMNAIGRGRLLAIIDVEVLQELMHFAYRRRQLDRGLMMSAGLLTVVDTVYPYEQADALAMMDLMRRVPGLSARDAVHAAVMQRRGLTHIVTADRDFARVPGVTALDPFAAAELLAEQSTGTHSP